MKRIETEIPGVCIVEPTVYGDARGFFMESYNRKAFAAIGIHDDFVQDNHSRSRGGVLRGLHYQVRQAQTKLVRVLRGEVYDVAVDIRRGSPHFGKWVGLTLREGDQRMLYIPKGFAHGFYVVSEMAEFTYKVDDFYAPEQRARHHLARPGYRRCLAAGMRRSGALREGRPQRPFRGPRCGGPAGIRPRGGLPGPVALAASRRPGRQGLQPPDLGGVLPNRAVA